MLCSVEGCGNQARNRGWCGKHYSRWMRTGNPEGLRRAAPKILIHKGYEIFQHVPVHIRIAEKALGKPLPKGVQVHHADENTMNNANSNLVICPDKNYHHLLHKRLRAMKATGNPNLRKCVICKQWDDPKNLYFPPSVYSGKHKKCDAANHAMYAAKKKLNPTERIKSETKKTA